MARDLQPRPTENAGPKRTLGAGTPQEVMSQLGLDLGGSDGPIIESAVGAQEYEQGSGPVTQKIKPTVGAQGTELVQTHRAKKIGEAQSHPPSQPRGVTADMVSRVLLTRIAEPMGVAPGDMMGLVETKAVGPPDEVRLGLNAIPVDIKAPGTDVSKEQTFSLGQTPVEGLTLNDTTLKFDNKWDIESGKLRGGLALGQWTKKGSWELDVDREANAKFVVEGCELVVGDLMHGTIDMVIAPEGLTGTTQIEFNNINIGFGLVLTAGVLEVAVDATGKATATGQLTMDVPDIGVLTLEAQVADTVVTGAATLVVNTPQTLSDQVTLESGQLTGNFLQGPFELNGNALVKMQDWAQGEISAKYVHQGPWSVKGTLSQTAEKTFAPELAVSGAEVDIEVIDGALQTIVTRGNFKIPHFEGSFDGATYDIPTNAFTTQADAQVAMSEPIDFGAGTTLTELKGEVDIKANVPIEGKVAMVALLPFEEQHTFEGTFEGTYLFQDKKFQGSGTLKTVRDVEIPGANGYKAVIHAGAEGDVTVAENDITTASGSLKVTTHRAEGELAHGEMDFKYEGHVWTASGKATFIEQDVGETGSADGLVRTRVGVCEAQVEIAENTFKQLEGQVVSQLTGFDGKPFAELAMNGGFDAAGGVGLTGEGQLTVSDNWKLGGMREMELVLLPGGLGTVKLDDNKLVKAEGSFEFAVNDGGTPILQGKVSGQYDGQAGELSSSGAEVQVVTDLIGVDGIAPPFTLELLTAYLSYRIWVLRDLSELDVAALITSLYDFLGGSFTWVLDALPEWMNATKGWVAAGTPNVLLEMDDWWKENLMKLGQEAIDWLLDMGDWGASTIRGAGPKAIEAAGFSMNTVSDAGQALGEAEAASWNWV